MGFFVYLLIYAAAFLLSELFAPKPETENARPSGLGDFNFPTATEGRAVPIIWGTVEISAPNIVWYGDLRTDRIREKVKTGIFSSKKITSGYEYYVGIQFALCRGPMDGPYDGLMQIKVDDDPIFDTFTVSPQSATPSGDIIINEPTLFGENSGGIVGTFSVFPGTETQARSTYLESVIQRSPDTLPAFRGTHYIVAEQIYVGNQPSLRPFKFTARRIPDGLNLATGSPGTGTELVNGLDANPMNVLYEILTDEDWGLAIPDSSIDLNTLRANAQVLFTEGNGFSAILDNPRKAEAVIQEIERQVDGILVLDASTGQYSFTLIRESQIPSPVSSLPLINQENAEAVEFSRASWSETTNQIRVDYVDPTKNFKQSFALAQDMANEIIQQSNVSSTERFMGVKNAALANQLAWRDLRALAIPLAKASITANRELYQLKPGDLFTLTWPPLGITGLLMRVNRLNFGELLSNKITVDAVEDVFTSQAASFGDPIVSGWAPLTQVVTALAEIDQLIFETPRNMNLQDPDNPLQFPRITTLARLTGGAGDEYATLTREGNTKVTMQGAAYTENTGTTPNFIVAGELRTALPATDDAGAFPAQGASAVVVNPISESLAPLIDASARPESDLNNLVTLVYVTAGSVPGSPDLDRDHGEFILYTQAVESVGGSPTVTGLQLNDCYRGVMDSAIQGWPAGSKVWFVGFGGAGISSEVFTDQFWVDAKILPSTQESGTLAEGSADPTNAVQIDEGFRLNRPLSPNELIIGGSRYADAKAVDVSDTATTVSFTALNWRTVGGVNSVEGLNTDGSTFDPGGADSGDLLSYSWEVHDEGSPSIGSPSLILADETAADQSAYSFQIEPNDFFAMVADPNGGRLRIEVEAQHQTTSPGLVSRERLLHSYNWTNAEAMWFYDPTLNLGRIPYATVVSPGIIVNQPGSPGSPSVVPTLRIRFATGARMGDGTGEEGKLYLLIDDGSPAQLIYNAQTDSPATTTVFSNINDGNSPSNFTGKTINILHYHTTGRPIFMQVENQATGSILAWAVLEPQTSTVPNP